MSFPFRRNTILLLVIAAVCILEGFLLVNNHLSKSDKDYTRAYQEHNRIFSLVLPDKLTFAGEAVPMDLYYVREGLDRELSVNAYWQSNTLILLKKANRFFPVIEPLLKQNGLPDDFKYLALIESGLSNVVSPAGASGFWQFIPETGKKYGLEVSEEVDERYHLEKATVAACKFLKHNRELLGNWTLAAAAYNAGEGRIQKETARQKTRDYYELYLNTETSRYIFRILAFKLLYEHPTEFGYYIRMKDLYPVIPSYPVTIDTTVNNLVDLALSLNTNYRMLKEFNPWLRKDKLTIKPGKKYVLSIPSKEYKDFSSLMPDSREADKVFNDTVVNGRLYK